MVVPVVVLLVVEDRTGSDGGAPGTGTTGQGFGGGLIQGITGTLPVVVVRVS